MYLTYKWDSWVTFTLPELSLIYVPSFTLIARRETTIYLQTLILLGFFNYLNIQSNKNIDHSIFYFHQSCKHRKLNTTPYFMVFRKHKHSIKYSHVSYVNCMTEVHNGWSNFRGVWEQGSLHIYSYNAQHTSRIQEIITCVWRLEQLKSPKFLQFLIEDTNLHNEYPRDGE